MFGSVKPTTRKGMNSLKNNEEAVSPVIGVILMVAVTVILAAIVAAFFFGMVNSMPQAPQVSYFSVERTADKEITVTNTAPVAVEMNTISIILESADGTQTPVVFGMVKPTCANNDEISTTLTDPAKGSIAITTADAETVKVIVKARVNGASWQIIQESTV